MAGSCEPDSEALACRAAAGDAAAVNGLLMRHRERLRRMVAVRMDDRLAARCDPSDVVQEALLEAARRLPEYLNDPPLPFYPWLRSLAWNRLVDLYRFHIQAAKRNVDQEVVWDADLSSQSVMELAERFAASSASPSGHAAREELRDRVRAALGRMKTHHREVIVMRHLEGLSIAEIAAVLGVSEGTVKSRHFRALDSLRRLLADQQEGDQ